MMVDDAPVRGKLGCETVRTEVVAQPTLRSKQLSENGLVAVRVAIAHWCSVLWRLGHMFVSSS